MDEKTEKKPGSLDGVLLEHRDRYRFSPGKDEKASVIGRGGIGRVLLVEDRHLGRQVALKELLPEEKDGDSGRTEKDSSTRAVDRFLREARITGQLEHPGIVPVHELGQREDGTLYYTMKLVRGRTLSAAVKACTSQAERLKLLSHFVDLCQAMAYAHDRGVIHRDIKPANVMVGEFGETVVLDWGLAKKKRDLERPPSLLTESWTDDGERTKEGLTRAGAQMGTPGYMSPEQAQGQVDQVDEQSDCWSLGAVLYVLLAGHPLREKGTRTQETLPTRAARPLGQDAPTVDAMIVDQLWTFESDLPEETPAELVSICRKALQPDKSLRYASAAELAADVQRFLAGGWVRAYEYKPWDVIKRFARKHRTVLLMAAIALIMLLALGASAYHQVVQERNRARSAERDARQAASNERLLRARALRESAQAALARGAPLEARAKLRLALEIEDDIDGRALLMALNDTPLEWQQGFPASMVAVSLNAGGELLAAASSDKTIKILNANTKQIRQVLRGHDDQVFSAAFSKDGKTLFSGDWGGNILVWSMDAVGEPRMRLDHGSALLGLATSPDGKWFLSGGTDGSTRLWDARSGRVHGETPKSKNFIHRLTFNHKSDLFAYCGRSSKLQIARITEKGIEALTPLQGHRSRVTAVSFAESDRLLASADSRGTILIWRRNDRGSWSKVNTLHHGEEGIFGLLFTDREESLYAINRIGHVRKLDLVHNPGSVLSEFQIEGPVLEMEHAGPERVVTTGYRKSIALWNLERGQGLHKKVGPGHGQAIQGMAFSPDGKTLATGGHTGTILIWDVAKGQSKRVLKGHGEAIYAIQFSPDGLKMASASLDGTVRIWDMAGKRPPLVIRGHHSSPQDLFFSQDGKRITSVDRSQSIRTWSADSGKQVRVIDDGFGGAYSLDACADKPLWLAAGTGTSARLLQAGSAKLIRTLEGHTDQIWSARFLPGCDRAVTASADGRLGFWDLNTGRVRWSEKLPGRIYRIDISPDGQQVGAPLSNGQVKLLDLQGRVQATLQGHSGEVNTLRYSPDGKHIVTGSDDGTVRLWNRSDGSPAWYSSAIDENGQFVNHLGRWQLTESGQLQAMDASTAPLPEMARASIPKDPKKATATLQDGEQRWIGYPDGQIVREDSAGSASLDQTPASPVTLMRKGPRNTLLAGYADGTLGLWETRHGRSLVQLKLHGPIVDARFQGKKLLGVSELGQAGILDISLLTEERCELLRRVWKETPVVWRDERILQVPPPRDHPCSQR